jgi:hypothetical protein
MIRCVIGGEELPVKVGFSYLLLSVKIAYRYEDPNLDQETRILGIYVLPREGVALADRAGAHRTVGY